MRLIFKLPFFRYLFEANPTEQLVKVGVDSISVLTETRSA